MAALLPAPVRAQVVASDMVVSFPADNRPFQTVTIANADNSDALPVTITVQAVENSGSPSETRTPSEDIVAVPNTFLLPPAGRQKVRLLLQEPNGDTERIYRVQVMPDPNAMAPLTDMDPPAKPTDAEARLRILTGVGLLVIVPPEEPVSTLSWDRGYDTLTLTNTGNTNIILAKSQMCTQATNPECYDIPGKRLYPGQSWDFPLPGQLWMEDLTFQTIGADGTKTVEVPYSVY